MSSIEIEYVPCDVFINHYGKDVKHTLARRVFETLNDTGLKVCLHMYWLQGGDEITAEIKAAMASASVHIAILSKNYALSPWCLADLSFMLKTGTKIIPVFYHIQPSDLRWSEKGNWIYAKAFEDHKRKLRYTPDQLKEWKTAVEKVSLTDGKNCGDCGNRRFRQDHTGNRAIQEEAFLLRQLHLPF